MAVRLSTVLATCAALVGTLTPRTDTMHEKVDIELDCELLRADFKEQR